MFRQSDGSWYYEGHDRLLLHEAAHGLIDMVMTGTPGRISIAPGMTGGLCRKIWDAADVGVSGGAVLEEAARWAWVLHSCVAGVSAEELAFGSDDGEGTDHDRESGGRAERFLEIAGVPGMSWGKASMVTKSWLTRFHVAWRAGARQLHQGSCSPGQMESAFLAADPTGELRQYVRMPFLARPSWLREWHTVYQQAKMGN
jgi:hypothetical protein